MIHHPPLSTLFPYATLFRSLQAVVGGAGQEPPVGAERHAEDPPQDRKSKRLNSSHPSISYAVLCLIKQTTWSIENAHASPADAPPRRRHTHHRRHLGH